MLRNMNIRFDANLCSSCSSSAAVIKAKGDVMNSLMESEMFALKMCSENAFKEDGNSYDTFFSFAQFLFHLILEVICSC